MKRVDGVTLIELVIVITILGIIAAFAYPAYQETVRKSRRADCQAALMGFAAAMQRHYTANNSYLGAGSVSGNTGAPTVFASECPIDGNRKYYDLTINTVTTSTFLLYAAPKNEHSPDKCGTFTLNHTGGRGITGQASGVVSRDCWQ